MRKDDVIIMLLVTIVALLLILVVLGFVMVSDGRGSKCRMDYNNDYDSGVSYNLMESGTITNVSESGSYGTVLVERDTFKAYVKITPDTLIVFYDNSLLGSFSDLDVGYGVKIEFDGPVMDSYPQQGTAKQITIMSY